MRIHRPSAAAAVLSAASILWAGAAQAQSAAEPASRAARDAENPMRMIIEASKLKVRIRPDNDPADAGSADKRPPPAARPPAPKVAAPGRPASAAVAKAPAAASQAVAAAAAPEVAPPAPERQTERLPDATLAKAPEAPPLAVPPPLIPQARPAPLVPLKMTRMVEPSLRESTLRRMRSDAEVEVAFTVNADGSVSNVAIRSSSMPGIDTAILEAVAQWRYQPIGEPRSHGAQLVLRKPE